MTAPATPEPRRVLLMESNEDHTVGGSHQTLFDLARLLDRRQFEPVVLFNQPNLFVSRLESEGIEVYTFEAERAVERSVHGSGNRLLKLREMVRAVKRRRQFLWKHRIDLLHLNNHPVYTCDDWLPAARLAGIPCLVTAATDAPEESHPVKRILMRRYDRVIAISEHVRRRLLTFGIAGERITIVHPGLDAAAYRARVRRPPEVVRHDAGAESGTILALMVGNVRQWKGQHVVLEALTRLELDLRRRIKVLFVGGTAPADRDYAASLDAFVERNGLEANVHFAGSRQDVPDLVNAADLCLHASVTPEPFGLVILEAMALGKPLIAAATGGPSEIVTPESGVLFDPKRPDELAAALTRLALDPRAREMLGRAALGRVERFSLERNIAGNIHVYGEALGDR